VWDNNELWLDRGKRSHEERIGETRSMHPVTHTHISLYLYCVLSLIIPMGMATVKRMHVKVLGGVAIVIQGAYNETSYAWSRSC
jgi:hypothetical protein